MSSLVDHACMISIICDGRETIYTLKYNGKRILLYNHKAKLKLKITKESPHLNEMKSL